MADESAGAALVASPYFLHTTEGERSGTTWDLYCHDCPWVRTVEGDRLADMAQRHHGNIPRDRTGKGQPWPGRMRQAYPETCPLCLTAAHPGACA